MPTSVLRRQKTYDSLGNFYINDEKEKRGRNETSILYLISHDFQRSDRDPINLKK